MRLHHGFLCKIDCCGVGVVARIVYFDYVSVGKMYFVNNRRYCCYEVEVILSLEAFLYDFKVQKPQETAPEAEAEGT